MAKKNAISSGVVSSGMTIKTSMTVLSGGTAVRAKVASGGCLEVSKGGMAVSATVTSGGRLIVFSGGTAGDTRVSSGGYLVVDRGGTAVNPTVSGGPGPICGAYLKVESGGTAVGPMLFSGGKLYVDGGVTAISATVSSEGCLEVYSGGTAVDTTVADNGRLRVESGGTAISATVASGGELCVKGGGTAVDVVQEPGANVRIEKPPVKLKKAEAKKLLKTLKTDCYLPGETAELVIKGGYIEEEDYGRRVEVFEIIDGDEDTLCVFENIYISLDVDRFKRLKVLHWVKIPLDEFKASINEIDSKTEFEIRYAEWDGNGGDERLLKMVAVTDRWVFFEPLE